MNSWHLIPIGVGLAATVGAAVAWSFVRRKGVHRWLRSYLRSHYKRRRPNLDDSVHVLLCIADHFEPMLGNALPNIARARVHQWTEKYPILFGRFRDSDGRPPRHSFFFPVEEYDSEYLDALARLCRAGFGEVEIHLHHDNDTSENLRKTLTDFKRILHDRHGLLGTVRETGEISYGFIHGNWALDNSRSDRRWCGVNNELDVLRETGCFADFTLPSAPSETQTRKINSIYWAIDDPDQPKSHDWGPDVGVCVRPEKSLLMIQGPLLIDWCQRKWGLVPKIENACIQGNQRPNMRRLELWLKACVQVANRKDWFFVKLHTHGANDGNMSVLLGESMVDFHEALRKRAEQNPRFEFHYVSAREMANLALAAASGWAGSVNDARDFAILPPKLDR